MCALSFTRSPAGVWLLGPLPGYVADFGRAVLSCFSPGGWASSQTGSACPGPPPVPYRQILTTVIDPGALIDNAHCAGDEAQSFAVPRSNRPVNRGETLSWVIA